MSISKSRVRSVLLKIGLFGAIKILYVFLTVYLLDGLWYVGYGSYGIDFVFYKECFAFFAFLFMSAFFASMKSKGALIDALLTMLFVLYYIPLNSAFAINNTSFSFFIQSNLYYFLLLLCIRIFVKSPKPREDRPAYLLQPTENDLIARALDPALVKIMCVAVCVFCVVYKFMYNGFSFSLSLESEDVYSTRGEFQEALDAMSGSLFSYIFSIVRNLADIIIPLYLYYSITQKKIWGFLLSSISLLSMFSIKASKTTLLFVLVVVAIAIFKNTSVVKKFSMWFIVGVLAFLLLCLFETALFGESKLYTIIIRRMLYYPAWLNSLYFEFFNENVKVMWTQETFLFQMVLEPQYPDGVLDTISNYFYNGEIPSPNTGLFAEAYMHWGTLGTVGYPVLLTILISLSNKVFSRYGESISILMAAKLVLKLMNVPMVRTDFMLSYILFLVIMSFLPRLVFRKKTQLACA